MDRSWDKLMAMPSASKALAACDADERGFAEWLGAVIAKSGFARNEVIRASQLNQTFAYQIIAGKRRASRDKLIQLAFGLRLGIDGASELLMRGGASALVPRCRRDVAIGWCLEHGLSVAECDDVLWAAGEQTLLSAGSREA